MRGLVKMIFWPGLPTGKNASLSNDEESCGQSRHYTVKPLPGNPPPVCLLGMAARD